MAAEVRVMPQERRDPQASIVRDVAARGARIRFVEAGEGPPLILIHDYLESHASWDEVLPRLAGRFRVIAP
ncbi:MAG: alpha/beta fold hydrolase, partial [Polyangiaceae bacterium]